MSKQKESTTLRDFDDVDNTLLKLGRITAVLMKEEANLNRSIQSLREESESRTAAVRQESLALRKDIELFCIDHKDVFESRRKRELIHGVIGFQTNPPRVALLNRKYNWGTVLELMGRLSFWKPYVRTVIEIDKETILADAVTEKPKLTDEKLAAVGIKIAQDEKFVCEPKWEEISYTN